MGVLNPSQPIKPESKRTSKVPRSSAPSSAPPSPDGAALAEQIAALTAKLDELREAGETDRATMQALRDDLAALKSAKATAAPPAAGRTVRDFFKVGLTD